MYSSRKRGLLLAAALLATGAVDLAGAAEPGHFGYGSAATPEQIAGRLRLGIEPGLRAVCAETIYGWIYRAGQRFLGPLADHGTLGGEKLLPAASVELAGTHLAAFDRREQGR